MEPTVKVQLGDSGLCATIDTLDQELVTTRRWRPQVIGNITYAISSQTPKVSMHRLILGVNSPLIDHRNRDGLDNRRSNLRFADKSKNCGNSIGRPGGTSRFRGVSWDSNHGLWVAQLQSKYRDGSGFLGRFRSEEDAALAWDAAALELWGEFARLNLPGRSPRVDHLAHLRLTAVHVVRLTGVSRSGWSHQVETGVAPQPDGYTDDGYAHPWWWKDTIDEYVREHGGPEDREMDRVKRASTDAEFAARHDAGETMTAIAASAGVGRKAVRMAIRRARARTAAAG